MKQPFGKSVSFAEKHRRLLSLVGTKESLAIMVQADPDALASAMALRRLFWRRSRRITIFRINTVARPDNRAFIHLLNIKHHHIRQLKKGEFTVWALIDSQPSHHDIFGRYAFDIIIDHHPVSSSLNAPFIDIQPDYGATATIMTEYLKAARIRPSAQLATALFYGIKSDTDDFTRETHSRDVIVFRYLYELANLNIVKKIETSELTVKTLNTIKTAAEKLTFIGETAFVHMGSVASADSLVIVADFLMKLSEATWSVVSGTRNNKLVVIFRNAGFRRNAGNRAQALFGHIGNAGGHQSAARAEIPLARIAANGAESQADYGAFVQEQLKRATQHTR